MPKDPSTPPPPSSPDTLERGVRGQITGVTRIGPRALGLGALGLFAIIVLILIGVNKQSPQRTQTSSATSTTVQPPSAAGDNRHFGQDVSLAQPVAPVAGAPAGGASGTAVNPPVPPGFIVPTTAPLAQAPISLATPAPAVVAPSDGTVPDIETQRGSQPPATLVAAPPQPTTNPAVLERQRRADEAARLRAQIAAQRAADLQAAYAAPVTVQGAGAGVAAGAPVPPGAAPVAAAPGGAATTAAAAGVNGEAARFASASLMGQPVTMPTAAPTPDANGNAFLNGPFGEYAQKNRMLAQGGAANAADYLDAQRYAPRSPYQIVASSVIPAELVTGIDSEQPGLLSAQVRQDVFDSRSGRYLLIPKGSRLVGVYQSTIKNGQTRILVAWQRLIFPDTSSIDLRSQASADVEGYAGLAGKVDNHFGQVLASALLSSVISAGLQLSQPRVATQTVGGTTVGVPTTGQVIAGAVGQNVAQIGADAVQKASNIPPTIHVPKGYPFLVVVDRDIVLPGPYHGE